MRILRKLRTLNTVGISDINYKLYFSNNKRTTSLIILLGCSKAVIEMIGHRNDFSFDGFQFTRRFLFCSIINCVLVVPISLLRFKSYRIQITIEYLYAAQDYNQSNKASCCVFSCFHYMSAISSSFVQWLYPLYPLLTKVPFFQKLAASPKSIACLSRLS